MRKFLMALLMAGALTLTAAPAVEARPWGAGHGWRGGWHGRPYWRGYYRP
jgi:hypothetical protein